MSVIASMPSISCYTIISWELCGGVAATEVREDVNKLSELWYLEDGKLTKVSALKAIVNSGSKVDENDILYLTEMLMSQLLKLDGIEAERGEKVQRKLESGFRNDSVKIMKTIVKCNANCQYRVQSLVEITDILKAKNSNTTSDAKEQSL